MKNRNSKLIKSSIIALGMATAFGSFAQAEETKKTDGLEVVIVTARKKSEASKDIPLSLSAFKGDALSTLMSGAADMNALSAKTPSVAVESSFGRVFPRIYIRGLGNTDFDLNASQPVSLVYDEVVFENPILKGFPVFDTERVEVLRGPQGTLFGRNTPAGVIKFDSVKPGERPSYVKVGVRSLDGFDFDGAYDLKVSDAFGIRASVLYQTQGDWINDADSAGSNVKMGGFNETAGRVQFAFKPSEDFDANLNIHGRKLDGTSQMFRANVMTKGKQGLNSNFDRNTVTYDEGNGNPQELSEAGANLKINYRLGDLTLTSITAYDTVDFEGRGDIDGGSMSKGPGFIPFPSDTADGIDDHKQITQEIRLASDKSQKLNWQVGAYYFKEDLSIYSYAFFSPTGIFSDARQTQETTAWALFGSATVKASDKLSVTAGLRYSDEEKDFMAKGGITGMAPVYTTTGDSAVSWDLSAVYAMNDELNFYARAAKGFRAPSIQGRLLFGTAVTKAKSEFVTSLEGGMKFFSADRKLRADFTAFTYEIDDQQFTAIGGAGNVNTLINVDKGVASGFEAEVQYLVTPNFSVNASFSLNNTEIKDPLATVAVCGAPCTVLNQVSGGLAKINGNPFPNAPRYIGDVGAQYTMTLSNGMDLILSTDWAYKGDTNFFLYKSVEFSESGYWEGGVRARLLMNDGKQEVVLYGRNITDTEALVGGIDFNNLTGFVNAPRVWGLEGKMKF